MKDGNNKTCNTLVYIYGEEQDIKEVFEKIHAFGELQEEGKINGIQDMARYLNITNTHTDGRIQCISPMVFEKDGMYYMDVQYQSQDAPCVKFWELVSEKYNCKSVYMSQLCKTMFESNDIEHLFFHNTNCIYLTAEQANEMNC